MNKRHVGTVFAAWVLCVAATAAPVVLNTTTIIDGKSHVLKNKRITIDDGRITGVTDEQKGPVTYDLRGLTVMPGWIDTHVHLDWFFDDHDRLAERPSPQDRAFHAAANAYATLMGGFTTVQSLGSPIDAEMRAMFASGQLPGPRLLTSLRQINENTGTPEQLRQFVDKLHDDRADVVKLFATKSIRDGGAMSMTVEQVNATCGEAKALGMRAAVHAHASDGAQAAIRAGCTSIEHGTFLDDATLKLMRDSGVYFDPNFLVLHNYLENKPKFLGIGNYNEEGFAYMQKALPLVADVIRRARAQHVKIVLGTDAVAGAHGRNAEEFIYRVKDGGEEPMDALMSGTSVAAESLRMADKIGSIAEGMEADIVAVEGNPLGDITAVRRVVFVMKGGKVYKNVARQ